MSKCALSYFTEGDKVNDLFPDKIVMIDNILNSRFLSGGLPENHFATLFSDNFNQQFVSFQSAKMGYLNVLLIGIPKM